MAGYEGEIDEYIVNFTVDILSPIDPDTYIEPSLNIGPIESITTDENGNDVIIYSDSTVKDAGSESVQPPVLPSIAPSPKIDFLNCMGIVGTISLGEPTVRIFDVAWFPSTDLSVTNYQVFWVENNVPTVVSHDITSTEPRSYAGGPLFSGQSDLLEKDVTHFYFKYPGTLDYVVRKLNVFIFAYSEAGRSSFPEHMVSYVLYDQFETQINKMYKEITTASYPVKNDYVAFNILDDGPAKDGSTQNVLEGDML